MDLGKLEGIVSAIEAEAKTPSPSHQNLARLISIFLREVYQDLANVGYPYLNDRPPFSQPLGKIGSFVGMAHEVSENTSNTSGPEQAKVEVTMVEPSEPLA